MKKTVATVIAIVLVALSVTTAFAAGPKPPRNSNNTKDNDAKKAFRTELRLKKQTMLQNHHELMTLRISIRRDLGGVKDILANAAESGIIPPALEAILPVVRTELTAILSGLKGTGNYGQLMRQVVEANKLSRGGNYAEALAQLDKLITIQNDQKTQLEALKTRADALLASVKAAAPVIIPTPMPSPTGITEPAETPESSATPEPTETPAESPAA